MGYRPKTIFEASFNLFQFLFSASYKYVKINVSKVGHFITSYPSCLIIFKSNSLLCIIFNLAFNIISYKMSKACLGSKLAGFSKSVYLLTVLERTFPVLVNRTLPFSSVKVSFTLSARLI